MAQVVFLCGAGSAHADYTWEGVPPGYGLAWSDEFNGAVGSQPSTASWNWEAGNNGGWGNSELENYTNSTANSLILADPNAVDGKALAIIALDPGGNNDQVNSYTSARMTTEGKVTPQYGYAVARIRMPYGQGIWPAYWMLGSDITSVGWPTCGENDIMENIGNAGDQATNHGSLHLNGYNFTNTFVLPGGQLFHNAYHTFAALWQANQIQFYVDGNLYESHTPSDSGGTWPYNAAMFYLLNLAVGGNYPGNPDGTTSFPQTMLVDYVRTYQQGQPTPTPVSQSTWRVRCGGDQYTDSQGNLWVADTNFTGGWPANPTTNAISGALPSPTDQTLYQYERYGNTTGGTTLTYSFNVPPGPYQVTLKFAEDYWSAPGKRVFNVAVNGNSVLSNFDLYAAAGGEYKALDEVFGGITPDGNGRIVIAFTPGGADEPKVDAIQVINVATPTPTPSDTPTLTPTPTDTICMVGGVACSSTPTFTLTATPTVTSTPTVTNSPTVTSTPSWTATPVAPATPLIYPNPAKGVSAVNLLPALAQPSDVRVQVYTLAFRKVRDTTFPNVGVGEPVSLSLQDRWNKNLADGLYYVLVTTRRGKALFKLLVLQ